NFDWKQYLQNIGIAPVDSLNVAVLDFVKALNGIVDETSLPDLKAYLTWHVLLTNADLLPRAFQEENFRFFGKTLQGSKEMQARWKRCVASTDRALGEALGQKFVEVAFSGPAKTKALELVGEIEKEMALDIRSAAWMSML